MSILFLPLQFLLLLLLLFEVNAVLVVSVGVKYAVAKQHLLAARTHGLFRNISYLNLIVVAWPPSRNV